MQVSVAMDDHVMTRLESKGEILPTPKTHLGTPIWHNCYGLLQQIIVCFKHK